MRRSLACAVFNVVAVFSQERRFCLCLPFYICAVTEPEQGFHHMAVAAVINYQMNESLPIDLCTQSVQQKKGKDWRWHLKRKIHGKDNKEGSSARCWTAAALAKMLPVYFNSCSQNDRE